MAKKQFEVALVLTAADKASAVVANATAKMDKQIKMLSGAGDKAFSIGRKTGAAGLAITGSLGFFVQAAEESEIAGRRLEKTFSNMGETDNRAAKAAGDYASELQKRIGVEDEEIMLVQSKLATFSKVSNETARMSGVFDRATEAAYDLAAGGFGEASQNAVQLGKALQDPARGAAALAKTGALNKADIPLIKQIQATRGLGAAQEYVLKAVEKQVKGQAASTATAASKMKIEYGEVAETLGKTLLPSVSKAMAAVSNVAKRFNDWAQKNPQLTNTIVKVVAVVGLLSVAISASSFVFGGLFKAVAAAIALKKQYVIWTNSERFAQLKTNAVVWYTIAQEKALAAGKWITNAATKAGVVWTYAAAAAQWVMNASLYGCPIVWIIAGIVAIVAAVYLLVKHWDKVSAFFGSLWEKIKSIFSKAVDFIKKWGLLFLGPVGLIIKYWDKIRDFFAGLWPRIKAIFSKALEYYLYLPKMFLNIGTNIVMGLWNGIKSKATALFDYVKDIGKKIANAFKSVLGIASPSKVFMDYGVNITEGAKKGIEKGSPSLIKASSSVGMASAPNAAKTSSGSSGGGGGMTVNFSPVINGGSGADILDQLKKYTPQLIREIESALDRKKRLAY